MESVVGRDKMLNVGSINSGYEITVSGKGLRNVRMERVDMTNGHQIVDDDGDDDEEDRRVILFGQRKK